MYAVICLNFAQKDFDEKVGLKIFLSLKSEIASKRDPSNEKINSDYMFFTD